MPHIPERGVYFLGTQPLVHKGFYRAWQMVEAAVMDLVAAVLDASCVPKEAFCIYVTGVASLPPQKQSRLTPKSCIDIISVQGLSSSHIG